MDPIQALIKKTKARDHRALAQLLTWIENSGVEALAYPEILNPPQKAMRVGITGPPGAGKSTLVGALLDVFKKQKLRVAVLAIDPSSPFTRGALLGDRLRFQRHSSYSKFFIRSMATRGGAGGVAAAAYLMARAFELAGFDIVLIETVGVGQTEVDIMNAADLVCVVLSPEYGDSIQTLKAGLLEIANIFIVNKADRPGAGAVAAELRGLGTGKVFKTIATDGEGVDKVASLLSVPLKSRKFLGRRENVAKIRAEAMALLRVHWEQDLRKAVESIQSSQDLKKLVSPT